jgi:hypothetical protein
MLAGVPHHLNRFAICNVVMGIKHHVMIPKLMVHFNRRTLKDLRKFSGYEWMEHISGTVERVGRQCEMLMVMIVHHPRFDKRDWSLLLTITSVRMGGRHIPSLARQKSFVPNGVECRTENIIPGRESVQTQSHFLLSFHLISILQNPLL